MADKSAPLLAGVESEMQRIIGLACALILGTLFSGTVMAQSDCAPHDEMVTVLNAKYQERQRAVGLINEKAMMEVYISPNGTWTMVVTSDFGMSCVLAAGEAWDEMPTQAMGPAS